MTQGMNLMCVSHKDGLLAELSVKQYISILSHAADTQPPSLSLSLFFFHCCVYLSTVSPNSHHHLMMTTARLKTSLRPGNHGNALRRQAG